jgi:hypothetical protein
MSIFYFPVLYYLLLPALRALAPLAVSLFCLPHDPLVPLVPAVAYAVNQICNHCYKKYGSYTTKKKK